MKWSLYLSYLPIYSAAFHRVPGLPPRCQERASRIASRIASRSQESARHRRALSLPLGAQP